MYRLSSKKAAKAELTEKKPALETNKIMDAAVQALSDKGSIMTRIDTKEQVLSDWFFDVMIAPLTGHVAPETLEVVYNHLSNWCNSSINELVITCIENEVTSQYLTPSATLTIHERELSRNNKQVENKKDERTSTPTATFSIIGTRDSSHTPDISKQSELEATNLFPSWADKYQQTEAS
jgi:hypothetical protein